MTAVPARLSASGCPAHIVAALESLQFTNSSVTHLTRLTPPQQRQFFHWCDRRQVSLMLPHLLGAALPDWAKTETDRKSAGYARKFERIKAELSQIVTAYQHAGLEFVLLKGLSHAPLLTPRPEWRAQGDIDLWLPREQVFAARDVLASLGYTSALRSRSRHLDSMTLPNTWTWKGDLFDPEMPISVELHYELWDAHAEGIPIPDVDEFWKRRIPRDLYGQSICVLCDPDLVAFAALHLLLHLLHGDLPMQRAWELARFLHQHRTNTAFWQQWAKLHSPQLQNLQQVAFSIVSDWFGVPNPLSEAIAPEVDAWLDYYSLAPLLREVRPNKSEVWLHLELVPRLTDRLRILTRKLIPAQMPAPVPGNSGRFHIPALIRAVQFAASRLVRHLVTLFPTLWEGIRWYMARNMGGSSAPQHGSRSVFSIEEAVSRSRRRSDTAS